MLTYLINKELLFYEDTFVKFKDIEKILIEYNPNVNSMIDRNDIRNIAYFLDINEYNFNKEDFTILREFVNELDRFNNSTWQNNEVNEMITNIKSIIKVINDRISFLNNKLP